MKVTINHASPVNPPLTGVTLELTKKEAQVLHVLLGITPPINVVNHLIINKPYTHNIPAFEVVETANFIYELFIATQAVRE